MPQTGPFINNKNVLLRVLDAGKSKIKSLIVEVSGDSLFCFSKMVLSFCVFNWQKGQGSSLQSFFFFFPFLKIEQGLAMFPRPVTSS